MMALASPERGRRMCIEDSDGSSHQRSGWFLKLPAEVRLQIYELALPHNELFGPKSGRAHTGTHLALLETCRLIYREAYPVFLSTNNFIISQLHWRFETAAPIHAHVSHVTIEWWHANKHSDPGVYGWMNTDTVRSLYTFAQLRTIQVRGVLIDSDEEYARLRTSYRVEGVMDNYLERTGLQALLYIPHVREITLQAADGTATPALRVLSQYMTWWLEGLRAESAYCAGPSKREVLALVKAAFWSEKGGEESSEDDV